MVREPPTNTNGVITRSARSNDLGYVRSARARRNSQQAAMPFPRVHKEGSTRSLDCYSAVVLLGIDRPPPTSPCHHGENPTATSN